MATAFPSPGLLPFMPGVSPLNEFLSSQAESQHLCLEQQHFPFSALFCKYLSSGIKH